MTSTSSMRRALTSTAVLATMAMLATLLAGVVLSPAEAGAGYQKPKVGQCRNLSGAQSRAKTNSTKPISCSSTHTAQTIAVGKLSAKVWKSKAKTNDAIASKCEKAWKKAVGRSASARLKSAFAVATFTPTKAQKKKGARWYRCDAVVLRGSSLTPLTTTKTPLLSSPAPATQSRCLTSSSSKPTTCDVAHSYKATDTFKLKGKKFPGKADVKKDAKKGCNSRVSTSSYKYDAPSKANWNDGFKYVICFSAHTLPPKETVKPATTIVIDPAGTVPAGDAVTVTGVATDNAAVGSISATVRNVEGSYLQDNGTFTPTANTYPYETIAGGLGTTSMSWSMDLTDGLPEDTYTVTITVKDVNGNSTVASDSFDVVGVDTTSPVVTITSPSSSVVEGLDDVVVEGTATDAGLLTQLRVRVKRGGSFLQDNGTFGGASNEYYDEAVSPNVGTVNFSFDPIDTTGWTLGTDYSVIVLATDVAGNTRTQTKTFSVTDAPVSQTVLYNMNEGANAMTMTDSGGNGIDAMVNQLYIDTGVVFNGATGYQWAYSSPTALPAKPERVISVTDDPLLDAGPPSDTFEIEMRYRTSYSFGNIIQKGQSGGAQWKIQAPGGKPSCLFKSSSGTDQQASIQSVADLSDNQWHTLRCVKDANFVTMYVDGAYINRKDATNVGDVSNNNVMSIGGKTNCDQVAITCDYFTGAIDYVKLTHS